VNKQKYATGSTYVTVRGKKGPYGWELVGFKTRKNKPSLGPDEIAVKIEMTLPAALFEKPTLKASINVDAEVESPALEPETVESLEHVLRSASGLDVNLTVVDPD